MDSLDVRFYMIKFLLVIISMLMMVLGFGIAYLLAGASQPLFNTVVVEQPECPGMTGAGASILGVGFNAKAESDEECNARANALLMIAAGMPDNAAMEACKTKRSMRNYATQDNCLNADTYGFAKITADVRLKSQRCGGEHKKIHWIKNGRYWKCMGVLQ